MHIIHFVSAHSAASIHNIQCFTASRWINSRLGCVLHYTGAHTPFSLNKVTFALIPHVFRSSQKMEPDSLSSASRGSRFLQDPLKRERQTLPPPRENPNTSADTDTLRLWALLLLCFWGGYQALFIHLSLLMKKKIDVSVGHRYSSCYDSQMSRWLFTGIHVVNGGIKTLHRWWYWLFKYSTAVFTS